MNLIPPAFQQRALVTFAFVALINIGVTTSRSQGIGLGISAAGGAVLGKPFSGYVTMAAINDPDDMYSYTDYYGHQCTSSGNFTVWYVHASYAAPTEIHLSGPSINVNQEVYFPANYYASEYFSITPPNNGSPGPDTTATLTVDNFDDEPSPVDLDGGNPYDDYCGDQYCDPNYYSPSAVTVSLLNPNSVMNVGIDGPLQLQEGQPSESTAIRVYRFDAYNTRTVNYEISGTAVNGTDYSASLAGSGSITIPAGNQYIDIPVSTMNDITYPKTLTITLKPDSIGSYQVGADSSATITFYPSTASLPDDPNDSDDSEYNSAQLFNSTAPNAIGASVSHQKGGTMTITNQVGTSSFSVMNVQAASPYATLLGPTAGLLSITRTGGTNRFPLSFSVSGTAIPGSNYVTLPSSIQFETNQTILNLPISILTNLPLTSAQTVVFTIMANSNYFVGASPQAVVTLLPNCSVTNAVASPSGRYRRGSGNDPTYWSQVIPLESEKGIVYSNLNGNAGILYSGLVSGAWSGRMLFHYDVTNLLSQTNASNRIGFNNPIVAFGERVGGSPLYYGQSYNFGIYAGVPLFTTPSIEIDVYYRTNYQLAGTVNLAWPNYSDTNSMMNYATNGFRVSTNAFGLSTALSDAPEMNWGATSLGAGVLTHAASDIASNYYYVVCAYGYAATSSNMMVIDSNEAIAPSLLYTLEFEARPPWRSILLDTPSFAGSPLPPCYLGKTLNEMLTNATQVTNAVNIAPAAATNLDASPELRRHPILDTFVASMGNDPIALANYVINNIDLTDTMDYSDNGSVSDQSVNAGGVSRGALGTFMEKQGSPIDQCALLVYLLRQAGVPAVYEFAPRGGVRMLNAQLSQILKFQIQGAANEAGQLYTTNAMVAVNYPWVAAYIGTNWVHIFPWLKDYEIVEGFDLYDYMPTNYSTAYPWIRDYIFGNTNLMALAIGGDNTPRVIFPAFVKQTLLNNHPGMSLNDIGVQIVHRQHYYSRWEDFPTPSSVTNVSTSLCSLSDTNSASVGLVVSNIFDTVDIRLYSTSNPTNSVDTGSLRLVDLHNREFYIGQTPLASDPNRVQVSLILMPFRPGVANTYGFTDDSNLLSKEVLSIVLGTNENQMNIQIKYLRNQSVGDGYPIDPSMVFLGYNGTREIDLTRPIWKGDQAAICFDYGRVTQEMLDIHAKDILTMESSIQANPALTNQVSPDVYEGAVMYLAGMSYYKKVSDFNAVSEGLHKVNLVSDWGVGLSKIGAATDALGNPANNLSPVIPNLDMFFYESAYIGNGTVQSSSGVSSETAQQNFNLLSIINNSAEEHQTINRFYQQSNAVSTVRLLQLSQTHGAGIVSLNYDNCTAQGNTVYQGRQLRNWDPDMWAQVENGVRGSPYNIAYITAAPMTNSAYDGMGALVLGWSQWQALISPRSLNGAWGDPLPANAVGDVAMYDLSDGEDYSISLAPTGSNTELAPTSASTYYYSNFVAKIQDGQFTLSPFDSSWSSQQATTYGLSMSGTTSQNFAVAYENSQQFGSLGPLDDGGANWLDVVADPVHSVTGEFYIDETDLELPGPLPLRVRRNYSSFNLADNQFGTGWKMSIMPYLIVANGGMTIYAADMDGAVMAYTQTNAITNVWLPTLQANPLLANNATAGVGGLFNRLRDRIVQTVTGVTTNYTIYGADGSQRMFQVTSFNNGAINRTRPYLQRMIDNCGNFDTFSYGADPSQSDFGQLTRIQSSNGNFLVFDYDENAHITDAYSGDGRFVKYGYDEYGDLTSVALPDGATRLYQYSHFSQPSTNVAVTSSPTITFTSGGKDNETFFIENDGSLWDMGTDISGELGNGGAYNVNVPEKIVASGVTSVAGGLGHTLFIKNDGSLWAMGSDNYGELGDGHSGSGVTTNRPEQIVASNVVAAAAGVVHSMFIKSDGSLWAMGDNSSGQLGLGMISQVTRPACVVAGGVVAVAAGDYHTLFLTSDGSVWGMGETYEGQLGGVGPAPAFTPIRLTYYNMKGIAAGGAFSLFLGLGGSLWGLGDNSEGQFGNGTSGVQDTSFIEIVPSGAVAMTAGELHSLFLMSDGTLWSMGDDTWGELGNGAYEMDAPYFGKVASDVSAVSAGGYHSLFIKNDGSLWGMGSNVGGQLGDGTENNSDVPKQIIAVKTSMSTNFLALPYSTHLLIEEDKPDGRLLQNVYDSQRRVTNQSSTAGVDLNPIRTATFVYSNNFNITNSYTNGITGYTLIIDGNGSTNRYDYTNSLITKVTDPLGRTVQQAWYADNATAPGYPRSVASSIDKRNIMTRYLYDGNGNVTNTVVTGDLTGDGITTQAATNTVIYNANSLPVQTTDPVGNGVVTIYDPVFNFLPQQVIRYSAGTPVCTNYTIYGTATNVMVNGNAIQTNQAFGLPFREIWAWGTTDAATNDLTYDGHGFPTQSIRYTGTSDPNVTTSFFYNERGQMVNRVDSLGALSFFDYDALNRPIERENIDEAGNALSWSFTYYNENGDVSWIDGPRYDPEDYIYYDYDGMGRRSTEIHWRSQANPNGTGVQAASGYNLYAQSFYLYDPLGNLIRSVDPRGAITTNTFDAVAELVQSRHLDTDGTTVLSTEGFGYEPGGQVCYHTNALGGVTTILYTATGRPELRRNPDGSTNAWRYYLDGRLKREIQSNGAYWQTTYDDVNRITTRAFYSAGGTLEATTSTQQDRRGNVIQMVDAGNNVFTGVFDGLNRLKIAGGPAVTTVTSQTSGTTPGGPVTFATNVLRQVSTNFYDAAGRSMTNVNALGEKTVTLMDALGRTTSKLLYSADGTLVRERYFNYSPDHNSVTTTDGAGITAISHTAWTDNDGHTVLSVAYPASGRLDYTWESYDLSGNLAYQEHDTSPGGSWAVSAYGYDGLNRCIAETNRDDAVTTFGYDALGDMTWRTTPGGIQWGASYNNAGLEIQDWLLATNHTTGTRTNSYTYYGSGSPYAGLVNTRTDGRGLTSLYTYDDWLRQTSISRNDLDYNSLNTSWKYDPRGYVTNITEQFSSDSLGNYNPKVVSRSFDPYGQLTVETIKLGSTVFSSAGQTWDPAGRRTSLILNDANSGFASRADGTLIYAGNPAGNGSYTFDTAGLLTSRTVGLRTTTITSRDGEGHPLSIATAINGSTQMTESLVWEPDGTLFSDTLYRPDFTDYRQYSYAVLSRRLTQEQISLSGTTAWTNTFAYDNGTASGPGVLTQMGQPGSTSANWIGGVNQFLQVSTETNTVINYPALGRVNGVSALTAWLDGQPLSMTTNSSGDPMSPYQWRTLLPLTPGTHQLKVSAVHPSGFFTAWATNWFTNNIAQQTATISRDGGGNIIHRNYMTVDGILHQQSLYWDAKDRLTDIIDGDSTHSGYYWHAEYDGLNRRLFTVCYPMVNGATQITGVTPTTINQYYDPQVEFLELGVAYGNRTEWKLYGPDVKGKYATQNGTGCLDAVSPYLNEFFPLISDYRGDILGEVTNGVVRWNPSRPTGYGAVPGYRPVALGSGADISLASAWRGHWPDITGYYHLGLRDYDPVAGMWLSYDSVVDPRNPNGMSAFGGDPINGFDSDGRCVEAAGNFYYNGGPAGYLLNGIGNALNNYSSGNAYLDAYTGFLGTLYNEAGGAVSPSTYVNGLSSYGHNVSSYYNDPNGGFWAAGSYALTSWNVGQVYSGAANFSLQYDSAGQPIGDRYQRGATISSGVAATSGTIAGGFGLYNWATAPADAAPAAVVPADTAPAANTAGDLSAAASRAAQTVGPGSGPVYGTQVHSAFEAEVNALGNGNLSTEVSYLNGQVVPRGTPGSVRLDVVEGPLNVPTAIYDLKTGSATLTPARIQQIQSHIPGGNAVPVSVVRP